jgi:hypothetical protein
MAATYCLDKWPSLRLWDEETTALVSKRIARIAAVRVSRFSCRRHGHAHCQGGRSGKGFYGHGLFDTLDAVTR